ncbi:hypothetical protein JCM1840_006678 [Sporobolomyces johnsonii]
MQTAAPQRPPPAVLSPDEPRNAWGTHSATPKQHRLPPTVTAQPPDAAAKKGSKAKDLSHVPCKFFKANSCSAGPSCPFSHDLVTPGQSKPVCQWFAKGNCKFGHKCALAHVLPGQPMSFDRKNKRAAQAALREAQANGQDAGLVNTTNAMAQSPTRPGVDSNGLARSLRQSVDLGRGGDHPSIQMQTSVPGGAASSSSASQAGDVDAIFGSPDSLGLRTPASSPGLLHRTLPGDPPHSPLTFATFAQGPTATFVAPASSGLSHHFGSNGRSSVAAQALLTEQARRLSSTSESLSPPRVQQLSRAHRSFNGASAATDFPSSPPLGVPVAPISASANIPAPGSIFGTSPFSGSRGLFIPSSYDSNEDAFPRSPPARHAVLAEMQRSNSGSVSAYRPAEVALDDDDEGDDGYDEGFLPSSLNDLLTPEEMRRRTLKASGLHGPSSLSNGPAFDPFIPSKSVPVDLLFPAARPVPPPVSLAPPTFGARSASMSGAVSGTVWGSLHSGLEGHNPAAAPFEPPQSMLSASRLAGPGLSSSGSTLNPADPSTATSSSLLHASLQPADPSHLLLPANGTAIYSSSFNDAVQHPSAPRYPQSGLSPSTNASLALPGSSLPAGLAAGLSRLHLIPPTHTGETPPNTSHVGSLLYSQAVAKSPTGPLPPPPTTAPGSALARRMSSNAPPPPQQLQQPQQVASPLHRELALASASASGRISSAVSTAGSAIGEDDLGGGEDEIQFDMDT